MVEVEPEQAVAKFESWVFDPLPIDFEPCHRSMREQLVEFQVQLPFTMRKEVNNFMDTANCLIIK